MVKMTMGMETWDGRMEEKKGGRMRKGGGMVMEGMGMLRRRVVSLLGELCVFSVSSREQPDFRCGQVQENFARSERG